MRHYRRNPSGSDKIKLIMFRILFVLVAAAIITFGSIILGNHLLGKVSALEEELDEQNSDDRSPSSALITPPSGSLYNSPDVFGASIILQDYTSEDEVVLAVNTLSQVYDTILLHISDSDGMLNYVSPALCELNRMPAPEDNSRFKLFASAAAAVKAQDKNLCVLFSPNFYTSDPEACAIADGTLMSELALCGVDEILVEIPENLSLTASAAELIHDYIISCRTVSRQACPIGVLLSSSHYLDEEEIMQVEKIADAVSFLGIKFTHNENTAIKGAFRQVRDSITSLMGSFSVYNMRIVLEGPNRLIAASYEACVQSDMNAVCFMSTVLPGDLEYIPSSSADDEPEDTESDDIEDNTNPYAYTGETADETAAPQTTEPASAEYDGDTPWY